MLTGRLLRADGTVLVPRAWRAATAGERMRGLLGRPPLGPGEGLIIDPCGSIHTVGMAYAIDVVFLDRRWRVVKQVAALGPWRLAGAVGARRTLELPAGALAAMGLARGDCLEWHHER